VTDLEPPLSKLSQFARGVGIFQLKTEHQQKMMGGGDGYANGSEVGSNPDCGWRVVGGRGTAGMAR
jgi:hypothetical protein